MKHIIRKLFMSFFRDELLEIKHRIIKLHDKSSELAKTSCTETAVEGLKTTGEVRGIIDTLQTLTLIEMYDEI